MQIYTLPTCVRHTQFSMASLICSSVIIPLSFHLCLLALQCCHRHFDTISLYCKQLSNIRHANLHLCSSIAFFCNILIAVEQQCWFSFFCPFSVSLLTHIPHTLVVILMIAPPYPSVIGNSFANQRSEYVSYRSANIFYKFYPFINHYSSILSSLLETF